MPNLICDCEDFKLGMPQIIAAQTNNYLIKKYTGKPFLFCPWCQKVLIDSIAKQEELAWQDYILKGK
jgi:hypothetical protein